MRRLRAYTLIEILIVIAIISFLMVVLWGSLKVGLNKSRDYEHLTAVKAFNQAVISYMSEKSYTPPCDSTDSTLAFGDYSDACSTFDIDIEHPEYNQVVERYRNRANIKDGSFAYYRKPNTNIYAVCTLTLSIHSDVDGIPNFYSPPSGAVRDAKGCFCLGPGAADVKCHGMRIFE